MSKSLACANIHGRQRIFNPSRGLRKRRLNATNRSTSTAGEAD
ncbi:hypothetical protein C4J86_3159 [Pseudomonas sp. R2-7-07]|nr:hypothetical protein C4J86_3159 [Pseudomonas sp. R2-7-07]